MRTADTHSAGRGNLRCEVIHDGQRIPSYIAVEDNGEHKVDFTPQGAGAYDVHVFYHDEEVRSE